MDEPEKDKLLSEFIDYLKFHYREDAFGGFPAYDNLRLRVSDIWSLLRKAYLIFKSFL